MKKYLIIIVSFLLALTAYMLYAWMSSRNTQMSPIPEDGIKVIQITSTPKK